MMLRSTLSNAFWKSTNTEYIGVYCSSDCWMMIRSVAMWSLQYLSWRKPACSSQSLVQGLLESLQGDSRQNLALDGEQISRQLLHDDRSPFFGSFTGYPYFHSSWICSFSQIFSRSEWIISVEVVVLLVECHLGLLPCLTSRT